MMLEKRLQTDILIVGGGATGLRAALAAAEAGSQVLLANRGPIARSGVTLTAAGGFQAPFHPEDSDELYFQDILACGSGLADERLAWAMAADACERVRDLEGYGMRFLEGADGKPAIGKFPGQSKPRNLFAKGGGLGLAATLAKACRANANIKILDDCFVTGLIKAGTGGVDGVAGACALDLRSGEFLEIQAKSVVIATGGCQWLWEVTDCPIDASGEGLVYAYRAGAKLVDMEMMLFYPTVIVWPPSLKGAFVHYEFLDEAILGGNVYDRSGQAILPKPLPVRDEAMRLMTDAIASERGGAHGGVLWYVGDSTQGTEKIRKTLDIAQYNYIRSHGVEPGTDKVETAPGAHYLLGGIHIDEHCETAVAGLFAAAECAGNYDGANRLAGNGLTATQVFGYRAGRSAHAWATGNEFLAADRASLDEEKNRVFGKILTKPASDPSIMKLRNELRKSVQQYAGVSRSAAGLRQLANIVEIIQSELPQIRVPEQAVFNQQLVDLLQLECLCEVAGLMARGALSREESRGHHYRSDFPERDDVNWLTHTSVQKSAGGLRVGQEAVR